MMALGRSDTALRLTPTNCKLHHTVTCLRPTAPLHARVPQFRERLRLETLQRLGALRTSTEPSPHASPAWRSLVRGAWTAGDSWRL